MKMIGNEGWRDRQHASERLPAAQQTAATQRKPLERGMPLDARDRVTVDLRGVGPAVKAEAAARHLTLAAFARAGIVASLTQTGDDAKNSNRVADDEGQSVKLTLRLPLRHASWLVEHARAAGLSYGTFLASVIDGAPYPGSLAEAVRALSGSTDQMAALSRDLSAVMRLLGGEKTEEGRKYRQQVAVLFDELRQHMRLTAGLAAEVHRSVRFKPTDSNSS
jgi:hypothetical protein